MEVFDNKNESRFEAEINGNIAIIEYVRKPEKIILVHTEVPKELEGKGVASKMIKKVLEIIKDAGIAFESKCSFISSYLERHPEYKPTK